MSRYIIISLTFFLVFQLLSVNSTVVQFDPCPEKDGEINNCEIHEVRADPCSEAENNKPCKFVRGKEATVSFDFTPNFSSDSMTSQAYWPSAIVDAPLVGMDTDACKYSTCPVVAGVRNSYSYSLKLLKTFPVRPYTVKWRYYASDKNQCCFMFKINLVKK